jgi:hypothetical protein
MKAVVDVVQFEPLTWETKADPIQYEEAILGDFAAGDGVRFSLMYQETCYRRGRWKLLIEVAHSPKHYLWGCLDEADQPERHYHNKECATQEAQSIADVLLRDRLSRDAQ